MKTILIACFLSSIGLLFTFENGPEIFSDDYLNGDLSKSYSCPPCGCNHDKTNFTEPGECPNCQMKLIENSGGTKGKIADSIAGLFKNNDTMSTIYNKFMYPAFFMGTLISVFLFANYRSRKANLFLTLIILALSLYAFKNQLYGVSHSLTNNKIFLFLPLSFILALGPSLYFYTRSALHKNFKFGNLDYLHFLPALVGFSFYLYLFLSSQSTRDIYLVTPFDTVFSHLEQIVAILLTLHYAFFSFRILRLSDKVSVENGNGKDHLQWHKKLSVALLSLVLFWALIILVNLNFYQMGVTEITYYPLWMAISLFIYWMAYQIIFNPRYFFNSQGILATQNGNRLSEEFITEYKAGLLDLMQEEKPYLDPNLNLNKLAKLLELNPKDLSVVLNIGLGKNFYDFINEYRIEEVKQQLLNPKNSIFTNVGVAYDSGFNSKSTFNALFKKYVKMTPKDYKKKFTVSTD